MTELSSLRNTHRPKKKVQRVGRGLGSKRGKTCGRGVKGDASRRGYKCRFGNEGGQLPLYRKMPVRGFTNGLHTKDVFIVNLSLIDRVFKDGDVVNLATLREKGYGPRRVLGGLKILGNGELSKKVTIEAHAFSKEAVRKLEAAHIAYKQLG